MVSRRTIHVVHNRAELALHELRSGAGRPLLLLHGLGEATPEEVPPVTASWPGPVHGLDFVGHGGSTVPVGGGYTAEILMADVDAALAQLGPSSIMGRGLGAYIALLIAGARPDLVRGVLLADGPGLVGGGVRPGSPYVAPTGAGGERSAPDTHALLELSRDVRPPDYAQEYVRQAMQWSGLDTPIMVATVARPEWLQAVVAEPGVADVDVEDGLARLAAAS
jgi:pimeloyl-ACP methyl ester carboxylesterase